ncbi:hypothetical protein LINPERPRIM_LOCUS2566, partial [Linum perenne]
SSSSKLLSFFFFFFFFFLSKSPSSSAFPFCFPSSSFLSLADQVTKPTAGTPSTIPLQIPFFRRRRNPPLAGRPNPLPTRRRNPLTADLHHQLLPVGKSKLCHEAVGKSIRPSGGRPIPPLPSGGRPIRPIFFFFFFFRKQSSNLRSTQKSGRNRSTRLTVTDLNSVTVKPNSNRLRSRFQVWDEFEIGDRPNSVRFDRFNRIATPSEGAIFSCLPQKGILSPPKQQIQLASLTCNLAATLMSSPLVSFKLTHIY